MVSSKALMLHLQSRDLIKKLTEKGVPVKIMAPITIGNCQTAQEQSNYCLVKHVSEGYLETMVVDGKHLFQFKNLSPDETGRPLFTGETVYTNDQNYVEKTKTTINTIWESAAAPFAYPLEANAPPMKANTIPAPENEYALSRPDSPFRKIAAFTEEKQDAVTEKDIWEKIVNAKKLPPENWPKDITRFYGNGAGAVIHPPKQLNLPDMIINGWHWDKLSSWEEDVLQIFLWTETTKGYAYVPVAIVSVNSKTVNFRKRIYKGSNQNIFAVEKDALRVRVQGNTAFVGWTVKIPLRPYRFVLPPTCFRLDGYSRIKPTVSKWTLPSGVKFVYEANVFNAFVTFFCRSSNYSAPGTDGHIERDTVMTTYPPSK